MVAGGKDRVTVWMDPDSGPGENEAGQKENLTTKFTANASFNQIRLRHGGGEEGCDIQRDGHRDLVQRFRAG